MTKKLVVIVKRLPHKKIFQLTSANSYRVRWRVRALSYALSPQLVHYPFSTTVLRMEPIFHLYT